LASSLAEALDVSLGTTLNRLHNSPGTKNFHLHWIQHQLTDDLWQVRIAKCRKHLRVLWAMQ
jgi:hypothetical protein